MSNAMMVISYALLASGDGDVYAGGLSPSCHTGGAYVRRKNCNSLALVTSYRSHRITFRLGISTVTAVLLYITEQTLS